MHRLILVLAIVLAAGCAGMKTNVNDYTATSASYIGDRYTDQLREIVIPVEAIGGHGGFMNLHIVLTAAIETDKVLAGFSDDVYKVINHSEARIQAAVVEAVARNNSMSTRMDDIRRAISESAQKAFDANFSKWKNAKDYKVEILLTSIYLAEPKPERNQF